MPARFGIVLLSAALSLSPALAGSCPSAEPCSKEGSVALEVKFITIAEDFFERIGVDFSLDGKKVEVVEKGEEVRKLLDSTDKQPIFFDEDQKRKFLEALQGDVRSNVLQAPKIIVSDGKEGSVRCMEQQFFVTGVNAVRQGEQLAVCPKTETFSTGFELAVQPAILKDKHAVAVKVKTGITSLDREKPALFPVIVPVMPVMPVSKEGKDGKPQQPVVLTQYLQQPRLTTLAMQGELTIPDGCTVVLGGWKRVSEGRNEFGPPVLSKVPYVNRLFKTVGYSKATESVLVMVTARIVSGEEKETAKASPAKEKQLDVLLKQFNEFFKAGNYREAEACALRVRELDPENLWAEMAIALARQEISSAQASPTTKKKIDELMKQYNKCFLEGKYREAEACALRVREMDQGNLMAGAAITIARVQQEKSTCSKDSSARSAIAPCSAAGATVDITRPKWVKKMELLLAAYHQACAAGRLDEARKLARQALEIDPTCFDEHSVFKAFGPCPSPSHR